MIPLRFRPAYPFQEEGIAALSRRPCFWLADEMGCGKTLQVIRAAERGPLNRNLVICPAIVRSVWVHELRKWALLDPFIHEIRTGSQATYLEVPGPAWWIVSYSYARRHWKRFVGRIDRVVLDEVHALRNLETRQCREILGNEGLVHSRGIKSIWALTGTPTPNHPGELYPMLAVLGGLPSDVKTYSQFCRAYCLLDDRLRPIELKPGEPAERLKASVSKVMLRRTKKSVGLQLPALTKSIQEVPGKDPTLKEIADSALSRFSPAELREEVRGQREAAMRAMEELRYDILSTGISTLRVWVAIRKRKGVLALIKEELRQGQYDRLIVFGLHRDMLRWLEPRIPQSAVIDGKTPPQERDRILEAWKKGGIRIILGQTIAMGTGLTLTEASQVLNVEPWWNDAINDQARDRVHRIGQTEPVNLRYLITDDEPFEQGLLGLLRRKNQFNNELWG